MEQKYLDELGKLGFAEAAESVKTVLASRAYHNTYNDVTDCSYAVLTMPKCHAEKAEKRITQIIFTLLLEYYRRTERRTHYAPGAMAPVRVEGDSIQFEFSDALSEKEITKKVMGLLDTTLHAIQAAIAKSCADTPEAQKKKRIFTLLEKRVLAIRLFIEAGSTSYEYHVECYDPLS